MVVVLARNDTPILDQVIEVPKVSCPARCGRTVLCTPQTAEQLVTVPTILYFLKQTDTRGRSGDPQRFSPRTEFSLSCGADHGHSSSRSWYSERSLRFFLKNGVQQRLVEQDIVFPAATALPRSLCSWLFKLIRSIA